MDMKDLGWQRLAPEVEEGDYWFDGRFYVTNALDATLSKAELMLIYADIKNAVGQHGGQDYLQVYVQKEKGYKLFLIDNVPRTSLLTGDTSQEDNYCTLMFANEY